MYKKVLLSISYADGLAVAFAVIEDSEAH